MPSFISCQRVQGRHDVEYNLPRKHEILHATVVVSPDHALICQVGWSAVDEAKSAALRCPRPVALCHLQTTLCIITLESHVLHAMYQQILTLDTRPLTRRTESGRVTET
jgi:hypothetical protein